MATAVAVAMFLSAGSAFAQDAEAACPTLPDGSGLHWNELDNPDLTFCKALRDGDDVEVFAVVVSKTSPFSPKRSDREEKGTIDGQEIRWYRGQIATDPKVQVRETLLGLADGRVAHVSLRARNDDELAARLKLAEGIRFAGQRLTSN
jgi:hypothetical protein